MTNLERVIRDLEKAPEGNRELDYAIAKEIGWRFSGEESLKDYGLFLRDATTDLVQIFFHHRAPRLEVGLCPREQTR